jgi:exosortase/archaeosortase family protein
VRILSVSAPPSSSTSECHYARACRGSSEKLVKDAEVLLTTSADSCAGSPKLLARRLTPSRMTGHFHPLLVLAVVALATWDSWRWYATRLIASPEEGASLLLTLAFFAVLAAPSLAKRQPLYPVALAPLTGLLGLYAAAVLMAPPIFAAALAVTAALLTLYLAVFGQRPPVAFWGLVALALPVLPSLQFVLGYPMRLISASLTVALLDLQGLSIARQGTYVVVRGEMVQFDAPCSGVSMLWALMLLTLMVSVLYRFRAARLAVAVCGTLAVAILCNVLRVSSLLYAEFDNWAPPGGFVHEGIGLVAFAVSAAGVIAGLNWLHLRGLRPWFA